MLCNKPQCTLQDWLSATSGWAGLVVAIRETPRAYSAERLPKGGSCR